MEFMHIFKKIEIWVLYLVVIIFFFVMICYGGLVRNQILAPAPRYPILSGVSLFLAEIPYNLKQWWRSSLDFVAAEQRFQNVSWFQGKPLEEEVYLLLSRYDGNIERSVVELIDLRSLEVQKTWLPDISQINGLVDTSRPEFRNLEKSTNTKRNRIFHPFLTKDGGLIYHTHNYSPLVKIDKNSELIWQNQEDRFHHSIEQDHEGNIWVPSYIYPYHMNKKYVGSDFGNYADDAITKVSADGEILFQKSVSELFIENKMKHLLFMVKGPGARDHHIDDAFKIDPIHLNDIQPVLTDGTYWKRGDVFLSLRHQSMVILYRPSTNKIIWKGVGEHTAAQHYVDILDDHRIVIFNNNVQVFFDGVQVDGKNEVVIYDFKNDSYSKYFDQFLEEYDVRTISEGRSQILDNGDLFIEEQNYGRLLFFNKDTSLQWQYVNRADNGSIYLLNWSRVLYKPKDIKKIREIIKTGDAG